MKQQPILTRQEWVDACCRHLHDLDPALSTAHCLALASAMWDRGECQVLAPDEAADQLFDERMHSGFRGDELT